MKPQAKCGSGHEILWQPQRIKATILPF
jgi:hypothetical protein